MTKRDVVIDALEFRRPAYVPWSVSLTIDCAARLREYLGVDSLDEFLDDHFDSLFPGIHDFRDLGGGYFRDEYGITWDRRIDKDIGVPVAPLLEGPGLAGYEFPDPEDPKWYAGLAGRRAAAAAAGKFTRFALGFVLYERAWTLRGIENLLLDMVAQPAFVDELLEAILRHNLALIRKGIELGVDCIHFGDDYGSQIGLIMGPRLWRRFFKPRLAVMYAAARDAGLYVSQHSCGKVQELFEDFIEIGLNVFNPFQPEVMDVFECKRRYHGRLAFHGGMSVQKVLPFGTPAEVRELTARLIAAGGEGGYVFAPSHDAPRDIPPENLVAMMEVLKGQEGYAG